MKWWRWPFGGLYWRLTVSYFLVTLVAVLTVEIAITLGPLLQDYAQSDAALALDVALQQEAAPQLAPYLEQAPTNRDALSGWVWMVMNISRGPAQDATALGNRDVAAVQVLDQQGRPLASAIAAHGNGQDALTSAPAQAAIHAALTGQRRAIDLSGGAPGGQTVAATPLLSYDGHQLGAIAIIVNRPGPLARSGLAFLVGDFFSRLQPQGFLFLLLATVVGTLTGVIISRSLGQRLRRITRAADDWSRGDLQVEVRDPSRDELGQLARRLNAMAEQLQRLLSTRQELAVVEE